MSNVTRGSGLLEEFLAKKRAAKANELLKSAQKGIILDIGCGSYPYFLHTVSFRQKYGIDPSLITTSVKSINLKKVDVVKQSLPFKNDYFDAVTLLAVFEHIDNDKLLPVLKEIRRVLKKNGVLVITTPSPWADKLLHNMALIGLISKEEIHEHKHNLSHHKIKDYLKEAGYLENNIQNGFFEAYFNMWFKIKK